MSRFFVPPFFGDTVTITGEDAHHIYRVLRMKIGEKITVCDGIGHDYACTVTALSDTDVQLQVVEQSETTCEPTTAVTLYQGLPKSDKMEWIIQKCVEIGITRIVPVAMSRSVVKLNAAEGEKKQKRWQKIAAGAAEQSGRGCIPEVALPISFNEALKQLQNEYVITFYEGGGESLSALVDANTRQVSIVVGPEGGFDVSEIEQLQQHGAKTATLGKRILRCETAPLVALSVIMQLTENLNL
ncbi:MAG: 16S rRNA (uracil(1498)-N(3))-methyltransferase [Clostridia bacterium]|nr:16S rRNA (uracil(1498)-N(3))-methyltransferase [Clostridia bacterium]